jgi:hypothetical protein
VAELDIHEVIFRHLISPFWPKCFCVSGDSGNTTATKLYYSWISC